MRHVVDEVIAHLGEFLLAEDYHDGEDKRNQQDDGEDEGWYEIADTGVDIRIYRREMNRQHSRL